MCERVNQLVSWCERLCDSILPGVWSTFSEKHISETLCSYVALLRSQITPIGFWYHHNNHIRMYALRPHFIFNRVKCWFKWHQITPRTTNTKRFAYISSALNSARYINLHRASKVWARIWDARNSGLEWSSGENWCLCRVNCGDVRSRIRHAKMGDNENCVTHFNPVAHTLHTNINSVCVVSDGGCGWWSYAWWCDWVVNEILAQRKFLIQFQKHSDCIVRSRLSVTMSRNYMLSLLSFCTVRMSLTLWVVETTHFVRIVVSLLSRASSVPWSTRLDVGQANDVLCVPPPHRTDRPLANATITTMRIIFKRKTNTRRDSYYYYNLNAD